MSDRAFQILLSVAALGFTAGVMYVRHRQRMDQIREDLWSLRFDVDQLKDPEQEPAAVPDA